MRLKKLETGTGTNTDLNGKRDQSEPNRSCEKAITTCGRRRTTATHRNNNQFGDGRRRQLKTQFWEKGEEMKRREVESGIGRRCGNNEEKEDDK